jgi:hypothetical protein
MSGRPPTPPNDEEMEDAAWPVGAGAGPAPAAEVPNIENQKADVKKFVKDTLKKIRSIPYANTIQAIKNAVQELIDDEELKKFAPGDHERFKQKMEALLANNAISPEKFKEEVRFEAGKLENMIISEAISKGLGLGVMELYGNPYGGKRKTRRNKKYLRKRTNARKTTHSSKR